MVMLGLVLLVLVVLLYLFHPLSLLSFRSSLGWVGIENHSSYFSRRSGSSFCIIFFKLFLLKPRLLALVSLCSLLVIIMLIQRLFPVLLRECLLVGMLIWLLLILWVLVSLLVLLVLLVGRRVLVLVGIFLWGVLVLLLLLKLVMSLIGGSLLISAAHKVCMYSVTMQVHARARCDAHLALHVAHVIHARCVAILAKAACAFSAKPPASAKWLWWSMARAELSSMVY